MPPPHVVADSNIIISAVYLGGTPERVLRLARHGEIALFYSPFILEEVTRILKGKKFRWIDAPIQDALASFPATLVTPGGRPTSWRTPSGQRFSPHPTVPRGGLSQDANRRSVVTDYTERIPRLPIPPAP
jgi:hypothetical protein